MLVLVRLRLGLFNLSNEAPIVLTALSELELTLTRFAIGNGMF